MENNSFTGSVFINEDGTIDEECSGIFMIYGLNYNCLDDIFKEAMVYIGEILNDLDHENIHLLEFKATNVNYDDGQISFPESGAYDYPPHWEMEIEITNTVYTQTKIEAEAEAKAIDKILEKL